jgi:hypothetical protein
MAANLYARSIFGEDVLANLSVEKPIHMGKDASVQGHVRIRAKSQVTVAFTFPSFSVQIQGLCGQPAMP